MTADEVRSFLSQIYPIRLEIEAKKRALLMINKLDKESSYMLHDNPMLSQKHFDRVRECSTLIEHMKAELNDSIYQLNDRLNIALKMIELVPDPIKKTVLMQHFYDGECADRVANKIGYSIQSVWRIIRFECDRIAFTMPEDLVPEEYLQH